MTLECKEVKGQSQAISRFLPKGSRRFLTGLLLIASSLGSPADTPQAPSVGESGRLGMEYSQEGQEWKMVIKDRIGAAITTDSSGNIYAAGSIFNGNNYDAWVAKYSSSVKLLWERAYNSPENLSDDPIAPAEKVQALVVDKNSDVYVVGYETRSKTNKDIWIRKYSSNGETLWTNRLAGESSYEDEAKSVALDNQGNVYVIGHINQATGQDVWISKLTKDGTQVWTKTFDTKANTKNKPFKGADKGFDITVGDDGFIYATGYKDNTANFFQGGQVTWEEAWIAKLDQEGNLIWDTEYDSPDHDHDHGFGITVDNDGNVYIAGRTVRIEPDSQIHGNALIQKYSNQGRLIWTREFDLQSNEEENAKKLIFKDGYLHVVGSRYKAGEGSNMFLQKYDQDGNLLSERQYNSDQGYDEGSGLALTARDLYVIGSQRKSGIRSDIIIMNYKR